MMTETTDFHFSAAPYPGLRPFRRDESDIFFGRDAQIDELLNRLKTRRFLGVVGMSGCGKSSLVKAGLLPALESGLMGNLGSTWHIAEFRPGSSPIRNMAAALIASGILGDRVANDEESITSLAAILHRGDRSLTRLLTDIERPEHSNLLILADQFEEIFRFHDHHDPSEAMAFINLLLATADRDEVPVHVVLTMRSDFLGACTLFPGLPAALDDGHYLCPRMTREELSEAIAGPPLMFGGVVEPDLSSQIINDVGTDPDQLPLMQHALMRVWNRAVNNGGVATSEAPLASS